MAILLLVVLGGAVLNASPAPAAHAEAVHLHLLARNEVGDVAATLDQGTVTLSGEVSSLDLARQVRNAAMSVPNVERIRDGLVVRPTPHSDGEIRTAVRGKIARELELDEEAVRVTCSEGTVTLAGEFQNWEQRNLAAWLAGTVSGVRAVENHATYPHMVTPDDEVQRNLQEDLEVELRRPSPSASAIVGLDSAATRRMNAFELPSVTVSGGVATLSGRVPTLLMKQSAREIAESTIGVSSVVDQLQTVVHPELNDAQVLQALAASLRALSRPQGSEPLYTVQ